MLKNKTLLSIPKFFNLLQENEDLLQAFSTWTTLQQVSLKVYFIISNLTPKPFQIFSVSSILPTPSTSDSNPFQGSEQTLATS